MKSTKILSADDVVTNKKVGQKYDIVQKYDNIRFYPPEDWTMDDEVLGAEPSANHVRAESATGLLCSSNTKTSVVGHSAVSSARPTPRQRKVSFALEGGLPSASDATVVHIASASCDCVARL